MKTIFAILSMLAALVGPAAEWQFAVETGQRDGRAFLWIPPACEQVRGVIIGQQVILEACVFEDPQIRAAAARENLALVLVVPAAIGYDEFGPQGKGGGDIPGIARPPGGGLRLRRDRAGAISDDRP